MSGAISNEHAEQRRLAVREALDEVLGALMHLADDLSAIASADWDAEFETSGRLVLQVSASLAQALVDWLEPMDLTYGDLDQVLEAIASREPELGEVAEYGGKVFEFLRQISYAGSPNPHDAPDMEDFNVMLERAVDALERKVST